MVVNDAPGQSSPEIDSQIQNKNDKSVEPQEQEAHSSNKKELIYQECYHDQAVVNFTMNLNSIEFWLSDYKLSDQSNNAQILKFLFKTDILLEQESIQKNLICKEKMIVDGQPVLGNQQLVIKTLKSNQNINANISNISIQNQIYESWDDCQRLLNQQYSPESKDDIQIAQEDELQSHFSSLLEPCNINAKLSSNSNYYFDISSFQDVVMSSINIVIDYKDLQYLYYLSKRYEMTIAPKLEQFQEKITELQEQAKEKINEKVNKTIENFAGQKGECHHHDDTECTSDDQSHSDKISDKASENSDQATILRQKSKLEYKEGEILLTDEEEFMLTSSISQINIKSLKLEFCDGVISNYIGYQQSTPTPLLQFMINNMEFTYKNYKNQAELQESKLASQNSSMFLSNNAFQIQQLDTKPFVDMNVILMLEAKYFNQVTQCFEPFIEPWDFFVKYVQKYENEVINISVVAPEEFKFSATYGMALSLRNIKMYTQDSFYSIDQQMNSNQSESLMPVWRSTTTVLSMKDAKKAILYKKDNQNQSFKFISKSGCDITLVKSDIRLDHNLNPPRSGKISYVPNNADAKINFTKDGKAVQTKTKYLDFFQELDDITYEYIEEELKMIDIKIKGYKKIVRVPIDNNGVYSYQTSKQNDDEMNQTSIRKSLFGSQNKPPQDDLLNFLMRITSTGTQRIISFESQLTFANNSEFPLTIEFLFKKKNSNSNKIVDDQDKDEVISEEVNPMEAFNVPLSWFLMKNTVIDAYLIGKELNNNEQDSDQKELIFPNITNVFNKCANFTTLEQQMFYKDIQTKAIELNEDFYTSVDIYGYQCFPKNTIDSNPIQFYICLNPPLSIKNSTMMPLQIYEIDNPGTEFQDIKLLSQRGKIAPSSISNIIELNISTENKSNYKFQFKDNDNDLFISKTLNSFYPTQKPSTSNQKKIEIQHIQKFSIHEDIDDDIPIIDNNDIKGKVANHNHINFIFEKTSMPITNIESFDMRKKIIDESSGINLEIYPSHIIVNKSHVNLFNKDQMIEAKTSTLLSLTQNQRFIKLSADNFKPSVDIDLTQIGMTGILTLDAINPKSKNQLQFGVYISFAPAPFANTILLTVVPRYTIINNLNKRIEIYQQTINKPSGGYFGKQTQEQMQLEGTFVSVDCTQNNNKQEIHLDHLTKGQGKEQIIFRLEPDDQSDLLSKSIDADQVQQMMQSWSAPISVEDIDDYQTQIVVNDQKSEEAFLNDNQLWYYPNEQNDYKRIIRVIISTNSSENDASILITLQDPLMIRFKIQNLTQYPIHFAKFNKKLGKLLEKEPKEVQASQDKVFVWEHRQYNEMYLQIQDDNLKLKSTVSLDQVSKNNKKTGEIMQSLLFRKDIKNDQNVSEKVDFYQTVEQTETGTLLVKITSKVQKKSIKAQKKLAQQRMNQVNEGEHSEEMSIKIKEQNDKLDSVSHDDDEPNHEQVRGYTGITFDLDIKGMSVSIIDNQPQELINITLADMKLKYSAINQKFKASNETKTNIYFELGNYQIDNLIDEDMPVLFGAMKLFPKYLLQKQKQKAEKYELLQAFNDFDFEINEEAKTEEEKRIQKNIDMALKHPFVMVLIEKKEKQYDGIAGSIVRYDKVHFAVQEFFISAETQIILKNRHFILSILKLLDFSQADLHNAEQIEQNELNENLKWEECHYKKSHEICPAVNGSQGMTFDDNQQYMSRISFGVIMLGSIQCTLSMNLNKINLKDLDINAGNMINIMQPILNSFASLTDCKIGFKELIIVEGYVTEDMLQKTVSNHYYYQLQRQILKILGSSNLLGNPANLMGKVGTGFYELARDPLEGMAQGPGAFAYGIGTGIQAATKGIVAGGAESISQSTGSLYSAVTQSSGAGDTRSKVKVTGLKQGIGQGAYGAGAELAKGAAGIFQKPFQGAKEGGFRGFLGGVKSGAAGAIAAPVAGVLRAGESVSKGVAAGAKNFSNYGKSQISLFDPKLFRVRPARRINIKGQIKSIDHNLAILTYFLLQLDNDKFMYQSIKWYTFVPQLTVEGFELKNRFNVLVITSDYLIMFPAINFVELQRYKYNQQLKDKYLRCIPLKQIAKFEYHQSNESNDQIPNSDEIPKFNYFLSIIYAQQLLDSAQIKQQKLKIKSIESLEQQDVDEFNGHPQQKVTVKKKAEKSQLIAYFQNKTLIHSIPKYNFQDDQNHLQLMQQKYKYSERTQQLTENQKAIFVIMSKDSNTLIQVYQVLASIQKVNEAVQIVDLYENNRDMLLGYK